MPQARYEVGIGAIDGVNTTFFVSRPYVIGTVQYFRNGQLLKQVRLTETDSTTGQIDLVAAPLVGDTVQFFYLDTTPDDIAQEIDVTVDPVIPAAIAVTVNPQLTPGINVTLLPNTQSTTVSVSPVLLQDISVTVFPATIPSIQVTVTTC